MTSVFDEQACLRIDPFEGDFGSSGDKVLTNKIVTARSEKPCVECLEPIRKGERVRTLTAVFDGDLCSYRWCSACCAAFVAFSHGDYAPMDERAFIRKLRIEAQIEEAITKAGEKI